MALTFMLEIVTYGRSGELVALRWRGEMEISAIKRREPATQLPRAAVRFKKQLRNRSKWEYVQATCRKLHQMFVNCQA